MPGARRPVLTNPTTPWADALLLNPDGPTARTASLGFSAWMSGRVGDANAAAELTQLGYSAYMQSLAASVDALALQGLMHLDHAIDVRDYGAVGDGVTDDTAAIQLALDQGGVVMIPAGHWIANTAALVYPVGRSCWLTGMGEGWTVLHCTHAAAGTNGIEMAGATNGNWHRISHMTVSGMTPAGVATALGHGIVWNAAAAGMMIYADNLHVTGFQGVDKAGLHVTQVYNSQANRVHVSACYRGLSLVASNANQFLACNLAGNVWNLHIDAASDSNIVSGAELGNGAYNLYCAGRRNTIQAYIENGGTTVLGVVNAVGPTVIFPVGSQDNLLMGPQSGAEERVADLGINNVLRIGNTPFTRRAGGLELAGLGGNGRAAITNEFCDSSFRTAHHTGASNAHFQGVQNTADGMYDDYALDLVHDGDPIGNTGLIIFDQVWASVIGDVWACSFWIKASRDMVDTELLRIYTYNTTTALVCDVRFITGLKAGVWTPISLISRPLADGNLKLYWQATGTAAAITYTVDDIQVEKFTGGGPVGLSYLQNDQLAASRTLTGFGWYTPKLTTERVVAPTVEAGDVVSPDGLDIQTGTHGQALGLKFLEEETTILAAASTDTAIQIPAGAVVLGVAVRVTASIPTANTFNVGVAGATSRYATAVSRNAGTTYPGTDTPCTFYAAATSIRFTPDIQPAAATGTVRVTIVYYQITPPTS